MIRVARFTPFFSERFGGPVRHILELTRFLKPYPIKTTIYTASELDYAAKTRTQLYQKVNPRLDIKRFNSYIRFRDYRINFGLFRTLLKDSRNIDIFHSHAPRSFQEDIAALVAILKKKNQLIISSHGIITLSLSYFQHFYERIIDLSIGNIKNHFLNIKYIAATKFEAEIFKRFGIPEENSYVIPHGIDIGHFKPSDSMKYVKQFNLDNKKIILYVGRLFKEKRIDFLIKAFSLLKDEESDTILLLVGGDSGYKPAIENLIKRLDLQKRVIFMGHIFRKDLPKIYSMADVLVMPAKSETFGIVGLEANACETPVIASNHWGPREIILNGKNGFLIEFGDIEDMKDKILLILNNENLRIQMGKFARDYIKNNYSWEITAKRHYELYNEIMQ